jgi:hypothetical protein
VLRIMRVNVVGNCSVGGDIERRLGVGLVLEDNQTGSCRHMTRCIARVHICIYDSDTGNRQPGSGCCTPR